MTRSLELAGCFTLKYPGFPRRREPAWRLTRVLLSLAEWKLTSFSFRKEIPLTSGSKERSVRVLLRESLAAGGFFAQTL